MTTERAREEMARVEARRPPHGRAIHEWLSREGLSVPGLARRAGISALYLYSICGRSKRPSAAVLVRLERTMGLAAGSLTRYLS